MAKHAQKVEQAQPFDLSTQEGTRELIAYLVLRFIFVLIAVITVEFIAAWFVNLALVPMLRGMLRASAAAAPEDSSPVTVLLWLLPLVLSVVQGYALQVTSLFQRSLALLLLSLILAILALPLLGGALIFSRLVVSRVKELQARREQELIRIDQQRSRFLSDVAHDLRTPIMAISGMAHAISDGVVCDEATREGYLASICEKSDRMAKLVNSVFDYSKLGSAEMALERDYIDLPQLLLSEAALAYPDIEQAGMLLSVQVPERPCTVWADRLQLGRLIANLLANASQHNAVGTEIALLFAQQAGVAYAIVADTGEPIVGDIAELFRPFSQGDAARSHDGGSGLGLSICKRIAQLHGFQLGLVEPYGRFTKAFVLRCSISAIHRGRKTQARE